MYYSRLQLLHQFGSVYCAYLTGGGGNGVEMVRKSHADWLAMLSVRYVHALGTFNLKKCWLKNVEKALKHSLY
jgi:hypothetical protein